jgi:hypothetical protein
LKEITTFDQLEYICRKVRTNDLYFGGLQVVGSGDFFQLPPVPDPLKYDPGEFCFKSKLFSSTFISNNVHQLRFWSQAVHLRNAHLQYQTMRG